jgi:integrase
VEFPQKENERAKKLFPWRNAAPHSTKVRVSKIVDDYLLSPRYTGVSQKTKARYLSIVRTFDSLILGNNKNIYHMRAVNVDFSTVDYLHKVLAFEYSNATIKNMFAVFSNVWELAIRNGHVHYNPFARPRISVKNERDFTFTRDEIKSCIDKSRELGYYTLALYIILAYETAQRPWQDLRNLKWDNIKQQDDGTKYLDFIITKTKVHLMLPLSSRALEALDKVKKSSEYIFAEESGKLYTASAISFQFKKIKELLGLNPELQFRDIRRTAVTELVEAGATEEEIRSMTGWTSNAIIKRYARLRLVTAKNAISKREKAREDTTSNITA